MESMQKFGVFKVTLAKAGGGISLAATAANDSLIRATAAAT